MIFIGKKNTRFGPWRLMSVVLTGITAYLGYAVILMGNPTGTAYLVLLLLTALAGGFWLAPDAPRAARRLGLIIFSSLIGGLYLADAYFLLTVYSRTNFDVVRELRAEGRDIYTAHLSPSGFAGTNPIRMLELRDGRRVIPVSGIANVETLLCNETGRRWITFTSDAYGFNNAPGVWRRAPLDIALVGDSFVQGNCVAQRETIAGQLRKDFPATASAGYGGNGPLLILATLVEMVTEFRPKDVFWLHYSGNDLQDVSVEIRHPVLRRYLDDGFSQGLAADRDSIDDSLRLRHAEIMGRPAGKRTLTRTATDILLLRNLRKTFDIQFKRNYKKFSITVESYDHLRRALMRGKKTVESWGGRLHFVYLPSAEELLEDTERLRRTRDKIKAVASGLSLPVIDVTEIFLDRTKDPLTLFPCRSCHYNARAYALIADAIVRYVRSLS